jgi:hypothetical protein
MPEGLDIEECYRRAKEARLADTLALTSAERVDLLEVERRWLSLARSGATKPMASPSPVSHSGAFPKGIGSRGAGPFSTHLFAFLPRLILSSA